MKTNCRLTSLILVVLAGAGAVAFAAQEPAAIWTIGTPDGAAMEFAPGTRPELTFTVGQSVVSRDFAGNHEGSVGWDGKGSEKPYRILFDLAAAPQGRYELVLDLIYHGAAPTQFKVMVNDKIGIFPIRPIGKKSTWGEEGNEMLMAKQHLVVPIESAWLRATGNKIALTPQGMGSLAYDAIGFRAASGAPDKLPRLEPTIFFRKRGSKLQEICDLAVPFTQSFDCATATIKLRKQRLTTTWTNSVYDFGLWVEPIEIPASAVAGTAQLEVTICGESLCAAQDLRPAKQWKVFVCPKVHNDVGYTDLQPHVNELDNRNTDRVLDLLGQYPFYKFNFETSWLVDNYMDCRTAPFRREFFDYARGDRIGINVLYLNLMTGICTGEELHRAMYFTHRLHRTEKSDFDFACLTDAPSHSWFLPTLLSGVGVKAFSNGSNQSRAPILHHSDLNEDSPYYWEGMNGERIFMWYARSYVQLKRLGAGLGRRYFERRVSQAQRPAIPGPLRARQLRAGRGDDLRRLRG